MDFVGVSKERAEAVLRLAIALRTPGGGIDALSELELNGWPGESQPFGTYLLGEALSLVSKRGKDALTSYRKAAHALPDLDVAWSRALELALSLKLDGDANEIALEWASARPQSEEAKTAALLAGVRGRLANRTDLDSLDREITEVARKSPGDFEVALLLLQTRIACAKRPEAVVAARELAKLAFGAGSPAQRERALGPIVDAFSEALPAAVADARSVARMLIDEAPNDWRPRELRLRCELAEERYADAAETALAFLTKGDRLRQLSDVEVSRFVRLLSQTNPIEAATIAEMSLGAEPGEAARWKTFATTFEMLHRDDEAIRFLSPFVGIEPRGDLRGTLAELLAKPGNDPRRALELTHDSVALKSPTWTFEQVAASRALALLNDGADAVAVLEPVLRSRADRRSPKKRRCRGAPSRLRTRRGSRPTISRPRPRSRCGSPTP